MFADELISKLGLEDLMSFSLTIFDDKYALFEGVKNLVFSSENLLKIRTKKMTVSLQGEGLKIKEIGEGNVLVYGKIKGVEYE